MAETKKPRIEQDEVRREGLPEQDGGILRREGVERGDELSIGGGPPSAAGGTRSPSAPTRDDSTRK